MTDSPTKSTNPRSPDWYVRGTLKRFGEIADRLSGRRWSPASSLATSSLIERIRRALDEAAVEVEGKGTVVPHLIELRMQWDKFNVDDDTTIDKVETELLMAAIDHVNDRLYYTRGPFRITVKSDYFTEGVKLSVSFGDGSENVDAESTDREINVTLHNVDRAAVAGAMADLEITGTDEAKRAKISITTGVDVSERMIELTGTKRITIGRGSTNDIVLNDASVSKLHAAISIDRDGNAKLADLGSANGTYLDGERIPYGKGFELSAGRSIVIGPTTIQFCMIEITTDTNEISSEDESTEI